MRSMTTALRTLGVLALAGSSAACATVTRGSDTAWEVKTQPPGAHVATTNHMSCDSTPCSIKMPRKSQFTATISKPGYKDVKVEVTNHVGTGGGIGMAGNVLIGGIIGAGVDVATGAMLDLTPNPVDIQLEPESAAQTTAAAPVSTPPKG